MQNARYSLCRKQETIFIRKQWPVLLNAKNRFYECSKHDGQNANFINVETDFINAEKLIQLLWNSNMKKYSYLDRKSVV